MNRRPPSAQGALWLLVLALLAVQTLGLLHGIVHSKSFARVSLGAGAPGHSLAAQGSTAQPPSVTHPMAWLEAMFDDHSGHDCSALDRASHADAVVEFASGGGVAPPAIERTAGHIAWHVAAQARGFLARGPPVVA